jgi:hypothetical protein
MNELLCHGPEPKPMNSWLETYSTARSAWLTARVRRRDIVVLTGQESPTNDFLSNLITTAKTDEQQVSVPASRAIGSSRFTFSRTVCLPEHADGANLKAKFELGILTVDVLKVMKTPVIKVTVL